MGKGERREGDVRRREGRMGSGREEGGKNEERRKRRKTKEAESLLMGTNRWTCVQRNKYQDSMGKPPPSPLGISCRASF